MKTFSLYRSRQCRTATSSSTWTRLLRDTLYCHSDVLFEKRKTSESSEDHVLGSASFRLLFIQFTGFSKIFRNCKCNLTSYENTSFHATLKRLLNWSRKQIIENGRKLTDKKSLDHQFVLFYQMILKAPLRWSYLQTVYDKLSASVSFETCRVVILLFWFANC